MPGSGLAAAGGCSCPGLCCCRVAGLGPHRPAQPRAAGRAGDLPRLACDLLDELEERRRLILTARTFASARRTYDSLATELGVGRERVRQLETLALQYLARAAAYDRYRPLRWRSASAAQPGSAHADAIPGAPPWMGQMLSWLADQPA